MTAPNGEKQINIGRLILVPALITLAVTLLRLAGELLHWSKAWFNPEAGGPLSIVGIVWLGPVFGIYFAVRLGGSGEAPASRWRAVGFAALGAVIVVGSTFLSVVLHIQRSFYGRLIYFWAAFVLAALATFPGWPALFKTMLAYSVAARLPVAIVMFFAFWRNWGTHYDAPPPDVPAGMALLPKYLWLGFVPQLTFWVGFTVVTGMLFGTVGAAIAIRSGRLQPGKTMPA